LEAEHGCMEVMHGSVPSGWGPASAGTVGIGSDMAGRKSGSCGRGTTGHREWHGPQEVWGPASGTAMGVKRSLAGRTLGSDSHLIAGYRLRTGESEVVLLRTRHHWASEEGWSAGSLSPASVGRVEIGAAMAGRTAVLRWSVELWVSQLRWTAGSWDPAGGWCMGIESGVARRT
jgi:hypothetical protein